MSKDMETGSDAAALRVVRKGSRYEVLRADGEGVIYGDLENGMSAESRRSVIAGNVRSHAPTRECDLPRLYRELGIAEEGPKLEANLYTGRPRCQAVGPRTGGQCIGRDGHEGRACANREEEWLVPGRTITPMEWPFPAVTPAQYTPPRIWTSADTQDPGRLEYVGQDRMRRTYDFRDDGGCILAVAEVVAMNADLAGDQRCTTRSEWDKPIGPIVQRVRSALIRYRLAENARKPESRNRVNSQLHAGWQDETQETA